MMFKKIIGTVLAAAFAASLIVSPASAHNPNQRGPVTSIFPALFGPVGAAALAGPVTTTATWTTMFTKNYFFKYYEWPKALHKASWLKKHGFKLDVDFKKHGVKIEGTKTKHHAKAHKSKLKIGKAVVGCVMGSALGAISASIRKATALGNPPRWRSQAEHERIVASGAEKKYELTSDEAQTALALCGAGSFALHWPQGNI
jgi:hypothetical protein